MSTLSIITPCDPKRSQFLGQAAQSVEELRSVLAPRWDLQWVVCFDGPTEETMGDLCLRLDQQSGVSAARNAALEASRGEFIVPLDADDLIVAEGILASLEALESDPALGWIATNRVDLETGQPTKHWHGHRRWALGEFFRPSETSTLPFHPNSLLVRTSEARRVGGWSQDLEFGEDLLFAAMLSEISQGLSVPEVALRYRSWDGQTILSEQYTSGYQARSLIIRDSLDSFKESNGI